MWNYWHVNGWEKVFMKPSSLRVIPCKTQILSIIKWCINFLSSGRRKSSLCTLSILSLLSSVYRPVGTKSGGLGDSLGISAKGSPIISLLILNCAGNSWINGCVFSATPCTFIRGLLANIYRQAYSIQILGQDRSVSVFINWIIHSLLGKRFALHLFKTTIFLW